MLNLEHPEGSEGQAESLVFFDTEDNSKELLDAKKSGFDKKVTQIAALATDGTDYYSKGNVIEFLKWMRQKKGYVKAYAHNLKYDLGNLFGICIDRFDPTLVGGRMIKAIWGNVTFLDSMNIWPMGAAKLGEAFGLKKLDMDVYSREYVFRDCEIIQRAMLFARSMASDFYLDRFPNTLGGLAVALWKATGGDNWFCDRATAKLAYYGGRVELFRTHAYGNIAYCDINSLYPSVMVQDFPTAFDVQNDLTGFGVALVDVTVPDHQYVTPLPVNLARTKELLGRSVKGDDEKIVYPTGQLRGVWTCAELQAAIKLGTKINKLHWCYGSDKGYPYYRNFIETFYKLRVESPTPAHKLFYKLLLNNLYGQLAMSGTITRGLDRSTTNRTDGTVYGSKLLCETEVPLQEHVNYLHGAYVTSLARVELLKFLNTIPRDDLVYTDTDSIIFRQPDVNQFRTFWQRTLPRNHPATSVRGSLSQKQIESIPFPISGKLGEMKLETMERNVATFGQKMYQCGDQWKAKGVPKRLARQFIEQGEVTYPQPFNFREACAFFDVDNTHQLSVWREVTKERITGYTKKRLLGGKYYPKPLSAFM